MLYDLASVSVITIPSPPPHKESNPHSGLSLSPQMEGSSESEDWQPKPASIHVKVSSGRIYTESQS